MTHAIRRSLRAAFAVLLASVPAEALELGLTRPPPTLYGNGTAFAAAPSGAVGTAELRWDFGDGSGTEFSASGASVEHTYAAPGHYSVIVVCRDDDGFTSRSFLHTVHTSPTVAPARSSSSLLLDEARGLVITANSDNGTVTLIDARTLAKVDEIPVFSHPVALALAADGKLWVVHQDDHAVAIVDLDARRAVDFFRLPYASLPAGIVFSSQGDAYVPLLGLGEVLRIDGASHEVTARRVVAPFLRGITISGDGSALWVTRFISQGGRGEVYRLDAETLERVARYDLLEDTTTEDSDARGRGLPNYLFSVAVTPDGQSAWVPSKKDNLARGLERDGLALTQDNTVRPLVSILDLTTDQERSEERIDLDDRNLPRQVTFTPLGDFAFVSVFGSNLVELRDGFDRSFVTALRSDRLLGPVGSVLGPDGRLFVLADLARQLVVFDVAGLVSGEDLTTRLLSEVSLVAEERLSPEVLRGKQLFANADDQRMSSEGYLSCASCHLDGFEDGQVWDFFGRGEGMRNTISLLGRRGTGQGRLHWSANFDEIQDFDGPIRAHQGGLGFLPLAEFQEGTRSDPLGDPKAGIDPDLDALAAYVTSLDRFPPSPFRASDGSSTEQGERGRDLFLSLGCDSCHAGDDFTDSAEARLHDVGTLTALSGTRLNGELIALDTPTLLGVWQSAPYLHDGSAATLRDVLTTHNPEGRHGETSRLSEAELDDLVAYLLELDHGLPPGELELPPPRKSDAGNDRESEHREGCGCRLSSRSGAPAGALEAWLLGGLAFAALRRRRAR